MQMECRVHIFWRFSIHVGLLALVSGFLLCKTGVIDNVVKVLVFGRRIYVLSAEFWVLSEEC